MAVMNEKSPDVAALHSAIRVLEWLALRESVSVEPALGLLRDALTAAVMRPIPPVAAADDKSIMPRSGHQGSKGPDRG